MGKGSGFQGMIGTRNGITVYGERPITQLCFDEMSNDETLELIRRIRPPDDCEIALSNQQSIEQVIIEAPLGKKYGVVDVFISCPDLCLLCEVKPSKYEKVEKRLRKQIPNYLKAIRDAKKDCSCKSELVSQVRKEIASKTVCLVCVTDDHDLPEGLKRLFEEMKMEFSTATCWAPYSFLQLVLERHGYSIKGNTPNTWAMKK